MSTDSNASMVEDSIRESTDTIHSLDQSKIIAIASRIASSLLEGHKVMFCGNGGSASQAQHFAAELVCKFRTERKAFDAIALTTDTSILTAQSNDYSFDTVFSRQVEAHGRKGDVLVGLSTSGNSQNVIHAIMAAKGIGIRTIALIGDDKECKLAKIADEVLYVNSSDTPRIQEAHLAAGHMICELVERGLSRQV